MEPSLDWIMPQLRRALLAKAEARAERDLDAAFSAVEGLFKASRDDPTARGPEELVAFRGFVMTLKPVLAKQYADEAESMVYRSLLAMARSEG